jgi:hypothetical protein
MAISTLWPKPPRWPIQPGAVDPNQRWVWHTRPRFILPLWEHAGAGAAQRYVRLAQTRRAARTWQLNAGAAAMRTPYGPGVSIPTTDGAEIEALAGSSPSFAAWEQNESYTIALLIKGRSGGASTRHLYRSGTSSTGDHILFLTSGTTPNLRHQASGGGTVSITSSVAIVNDTTWSTIVGTWRPGGERAPVRCIGAWSPRARAGFPLAAPVSWRQVENGIRPDAFTLKNPLRR